MKDYREMTDAVFRRRDEYLAAQKKRRSALLKGGVSVSSLLLVILVGVFIWQGNIWREIPHVDPTVPEPTVSGTQFTTEDLDMDIPQSTAEVTAEVIAATDAPEQTRYTEHKVNTTQNVIGQEETTQKPTEQQTTLPADPVEKPTQSVSTESPGAESDMVPDGTIVPPNASSNGATSATEGSGALPNATAEPTAVEDDTDFIVEDDTGFTAEDATAAPEWTPPESTEPTTAPTGPATVVIDGVPYEAYTGDVITYTVELYVDKRIESIQFAVSYSDGLQAVELVNTREENPAPYHYPNLTGGSEMMNYTKRAYWYDNKTEAFVLGSNIGGYDFREQKLLFTCGFEVTAPGESEMYFDMQELTAKGGERYFVNSEQVVLEGVSIVKTSAITPADEVTEPTAPEPTEPEGTAPPFTYPEESTEGDLLIHCDDRTYAADIGDTVTYVAELEAVERFTGICAMMDYGEGELKLVIPLGSDGEPDYKASCPNMHSSIVNYYGGVSDGEIVDQNVKVVASSAFIKYDFRRRKVLLTLDFVAESSGEIDLDMIIVDFYADVDKAYIEQGEQLISEGVELYQYVIVS